MQSKKPCPKCNRNAPKGQSGLYPQEWAQYFCDPCGHSFTYEVTDDDDDT